MRVEQLEYLMAVIRHGSLRKAGDHLHLSQPALSESVRNLERELGVTLLDRRRTGTRVSREGRDLLPTIVDVLDAVDRLRTAADDREPPTHEVRVGMLGAGAPSLVACAVRDLREDRPRVAVAISSVAQSDVVTGLAEGALDLGLVDVLHGDVVPSDVGAVELLRGELVVACHPEHPFADRESVTVEDLRTESYVAVRAGHLGHRPTHSILGERTSAPVASTDVAGMATSLVAEGLGVAVLPDYCVHEDPLVRAGAVAHRPIAGDPVAVSLLCLHRGGPPLSAAVRALQERLVHHARAGEPAGPSRG